MSRGTFVAKYDGTIESGTATSAGFIYVDFRDRRTGTACVSFRATYTNRAQDATGTFRALGGTGDAARLRVSGSVTEQFAPQPSGEVQTSMSGRGRAGLGRRRGLPAA